MARVAPAPQELTHRRCSPQCRAHPRAPSSIRRMRLVSVAEANLGEAAAAALHAGLPQPCAGGAKRHPRGGHKNLETKSDEGTSGKPHGQVCQQKKEANKQPEGLASRGSPQSLEAKDALEAAAAALVKPARPARRRTMALRPCHKTCVSHLDATEEAVCWRGCRRGLRRFCGQLQAPALGGGLLWGLCRQGAVRRLLHDQYCEETQAVLPGYN